MELLENKAGDSSMKKLNKRKKQKAKKKLMEANGPQNVDQNAGNLKDSERMGVCEIVTDGLEMNLTVKDLSVQSMLECPKTVAGSIESLPDVNTAMNGKKKRKRVKKKKNTDETLSVDQDTVDVGATRSPAEGSVVGNRRKKKHNNKKAKIKAETQNTKQTDDLMHSHLSNREEIEGKLIENDCIAQESKISPRKESPVADSMHRKENFVSFCNAEAVGSSNAIEGSSTRYLSELGEDCPELSLEPMKVKGKRSPLEIQHRRSTNRMDVEIENYNVGINEVNIECTAQESEISTTKGPSSSDLVPDTENLLDSLKDETVDLSHGLEDSSNRISSKFVPSLEPMEVGGKFIPLETKHKTTVNPVDGENEAFKSGINEANNEIVVDEENCSAEGRNAFSSCNVDVALHLSSPDVKEAECTAEDLGQYPQILAPINRLKRKLLVLDVNGLLAHIVMPPPHDCTANAYILGRAIFKRPFCDDFLRFCFENFDVGIWSSRSKRIIERVVEYLLGTLRSKVKFCWDMDHSTQTGFKTLENSHKPLVFKELRKIWENEDPNLPWKKGDYDESNTLLLDDSPYKALLNPLHTAIFPHSYRYEYTRDNSLGPGGSLRVYLEGLLISENVQTYVKQHPFGQRPINENNLYWAFYSGVLQTMSNRMEHNDHNGVPTLSSL